ncbi:GCNT2 transferase, partial [Caloenas nicobarica]|nr:GCNT2 transferase [Caloenas nicobarica]
ITCTLLAKEAAFPIAYIMTLRTEFETFEWLFRVVYMPQNICYIHVDTKVLAPSQQAVQRLVGCFPNSFLASRAERVVCGSISHRRADLHSMRDLLASPVPWCYLLNTCGQDFPLKTNWEIIWLLKDFGGKNITSRMLLAPRITTHTKYVDREGARHNALGLVTPWLCKLPLPHNIILYFGSIYVAITQHFVAITQHFVAIAQPFVEIVLQDRQAINLLTWSKDTCSPDEHFWVTLNRIPG